MDRRRCIGAAASVLALLVLAAASLEPAAPGGGARLAPTPDEGCTEATPAPGTTPGAGQTESCESRGAGSGGVGAGAIASILPLVALVGGGVLLIALIGAVLVFRSQPRGVPEPVEGWWTCAACGSSNLAGSPRCHNCGAWPPTSQARPRGRVAPP